MSINEGHIQARRWGTRNQADTTGTTNEHERLNDIPITFDSPAVGILKS